MNGTESNQSKLNLHGLIFDFDKMTNGQAGRLVT